MPERYDLVRAEFDPARAEELRGLLRRELRDVSAFEASQPHIAPPKEITVAIVDEPTTMKRGGRGRVLAVAAAVVVAALAVTAIAINLRDSDRSPADQPQPTATTVSTAPPLSDDEIAAATLLADDEYGTGFVPLTLNGTSPWGAGMKMDSTLAEQVPACAPFIDVAFESPTRDASVAYTFFNTTSPSPPSPEPQYVVVFPTEEAAVAMFDAITDPAFFYGCVSGYGALMTDPAFGDPDFVWFPIFPDTTALDAPELNVTADDVLVRAYSDEEHSPGARFVAATVRVGRVVALIEGLTRDINGDPVQTTEDFQRVVSTMVDRAEAALAGQPLD